MRPGYTYRRRSRASRPGLWWLVLPAIIVLATVALSSRLPEDGGSLLTAAPAGCDTVADCAPLVAAPAGCAAGGDCRPSQGGVAVAESAFPPATIAGRAAAVIEEPCGAMLLDLNAHERRAPASLTKIATALVAVGRAGLDEMVDVRVEGAELAMATDSTTMGLTLGMRLSLRDLLYGLLLPSGNDAAIAIAEHVGGSVPDFVDLMNGMVREMGLEDTHFANPHGLDDPALYTSAFDIAALGRALLREPELAAVVRTPMYQPAWDGPPLWNGNRLLQLYPESIGVKIGFTDEAGQTIVAAAERDGRRVLVSVLGSSAVYDDAIRLFEWAFEQPAACP